MVVNVYCDQDNPEDCTIDSLESLERGELGPFTDQTTHSMIVMHERGRSLISFFQVSTDRYVHETEM